MIGLDPICLIAINMYQYVCINGYESGLAAMNCGVSQGHSLHTPPPLPLGEGGGVLSPFSECLYRRALGQIGTLGGNWYFRWGVIFFRWELKTPCIKNLKQKNKLLQL